jgi:hypothetical protein
MLTNDDSVTLVLRDLHQARAHWMAETTPEGRKVRMNRIDRLLERLYRLRRDAEIQRLEGILGVPSPRP